MQQIENIKELQKSAPDQFSFLLRIGNKCQSTSLTNVFTGDPAIPVIGKYSRNQYHFLTVDVLIQMDLNLNEDCYYSQGCKVNLPDNVIKILHNIPEQIIHNKPPPKDNNKKGGKKQNKKQGKQKQQQEQQIQQQLQQQFDNEPQLVQKDQKEYEHDEEFQIILFHPLQFHKSHNIKFSWIISSLQNKKILEPMKQEPCLSYVNHNWVFEIINFEHTKKIIQHLPICVVDPKGVYEYPDPYKGLSFTGLRSEYMSVHLGPQGSLCFSPNNMKMMVDMKCPLISFWTVILQEDGIHQVNLHWVILHEMFSEMSHVIAKENKTIEQLIMNYREFSNEYKAECEQINKIFV
ncbi:unnamed protein product [Paramecium primaurelia]|uniref:Uncharacterized protein n=1 Tax=Paramecium primaurelia TaxID=5886 RepID=A0A8S1N4S0_PARPR|nr:unnamed protein product [Paramecium primaurelia]